MLITCRGALGLADLLTRELEAAGASVAAVGRGVFGAAQGHLAQHLMVTGPEPVLVNVVESVRRRGPSLRMDISESRGAAFVTLVADHADHADHAAPEAHADLQLAVAA